MEFIKTYHVKRTTYNITNETNYTRGGPAGYRQHAFA